MNGYVRNKSNVWLHAMKRSIGPGLKVPLDELFEQYGKKHGLPEGKPFADWLRSVKLPDSQVWEVVYSEAKEAPAEEKSAPKAETKADQAAQMTVPFVKSKMVPADIVNMSVRDARQTLKKITDIDLLKYAYNETRQLANKDTMSILLRRRIQELEITRR
jgi:hypothetical protein